MRRCCVCNNDELKENADVLFINKQGEYEELCDKCSSKLEVIEKNENPKEVRRAVYYFESLLDNIEDFEVRKYIEDLINKYDTNMQNSVPNEEETQFENTENGSIWVKGLKAVAWVLFFSVILAGIIFGAMLGDFVGFLLFLGSFPIAFLCVAGMMIFLDAAADIRAIKNKLQN